VRLSKKTDGKTVYRKLGGYSDEENTEERSEVSIRKRRKVGEKRYVWKWEEPKSKVKTKKHKNK